MGPSAQVRHAQGDRFRSEQDSRRRRAQEEGRELHADGGDGSYRYMAPEVYRHEEYNEKVDVPMR